MAFIDQPTAKRNLETRKEECGTKVKPTTLWFTEGILTPGPPWEACIEFMLEYNSIPQTHFATELAIAIDCDPQFEAATV